MKMLGQNVVKLEKFDGLIYNIWRRLLLFVHENVCVGEIPFLVDCHDIDIMS